MESREVQGASDGSGFGGRRSRSTASSIEAIEKGRGRPLLFLHPGIGLDRNAARARPACRACARDRAEPSGLRQLRAAASRSPPSTTSPISISICSTSSTSQDVDRRRRVARRLDRGRDRGEIDRAALASRARQCGRHQGRRPRDARHRRHLCDHRAGAQRARLFRSERSPRATTRRWRRPTCASWRATAKRPRATAGRPTCTIPSSRAGCIASASRRCSCGAPPTASCRRPMGAPIARPSRARASRRSSAPAIFRISSSPTNSPAGSSPSSKDNAT